MFELTQSVNRTRYAGAIVSGATLAGWREAPVATAAGSSSSLLRSQIVAMELPLAPQMSIDELEQEFDAAEAVGQKTKLLPTLDLSIDKRACGIPFPAPDSLHLPRQARDRREEEVGEKKKCFLQATEAAAQSEGEDSVAYRDARAIAERWCEKENNPKKRSILRYHCLTNYEPRSFAKTGSGQA